MTALRLELPLRLLIKGASTVNWISGMGGPRTDFLFSRVIQEQLIRRGQPCDVTVSAVASQKSSALLDAWTWEVLNDSPDVIVLIYGHYETIHAFLPRWLEVRSNSLTSKPRRLRKTIRRLVIRPVWKSLARVQRSLDSALPSTVRHRERHVVADLEQFISYAQGVASPLVLLVELLPPGTRARRWFPGMADRIEVMNAAIRDLVQRIDNPNVQYVTTRDLVEDRFGDDLDAAVPDGFHYSPRLHRLVGERLGEKITSWAESQPHLVLSDTARQRP